MATQKRTETKVEKVIKFLPASILIAEASTAKGPSKKIQAIAAATGALPLAPKEKKAVGLVADAIVAAFNIAGIFAHGAAK